MTNELIKRLLQNGGEAQVQALIDKFEARTGLKFSEPFELAGMPNRLYKADVIIPFDAPILVRWRLDRGELSDWLPLRDSDFARCCKSKNVCL